jgi:LCP family protein required for cell wall assembly
MEPEAPVFEYRKPRHQRIKLPGGGFGKWAKRLALVVLLAVVLTAGWFGFKAFMAARHIFARGSGGAPALAGIIDPTKLKGEGDGRINVLVLGIGGAGHDGPNLSDTIMVISIDPKTKDAAMLSVPRDLYVKIPAVGKYSTHYAKINEANSDGGPMEAEKVVSSVLGVPIHYYVVIDFSGFKQAVDSVGGVDINVPTTLSDPYYPCDDGTKYANRYCPIYFKAGMTHMNGDQALRYSRSRETTSDFDRAARQQQVISALRVKSMQLSTLTNPVKLTGLIDSIGDHVKTDFQPNEITKMASIVKDIDPGKVTNKVLDTTGPDSLLVDATNKIPGAGSIELPRKGNFDYGDIQDFVKNIFVDQYITDENARIEVQNGSGLSGVASSVVKSLKSAHYNVGDPVNADSHYAKTVIYDYTGGKKPYTINYLEHRFGVKATKAPAPSPTTDANGNTVAPPEIRIILGSDYNSTSTSQ